MQMGGVTVRKVRDHNSSSTSPQAHLFLPCQGFLSAHQLKPHPVLDQARNGEDRQSEATADAPL